MYFSGFPTSVEVADSYIPTAASFAFSVSSHAGGAPGSRPLRHLLGPGHEAARPLTSPSPPVRLPGPPATGWGVPDLPDSAPAPSPGNAVYYLTSVTYQGQTRAGRKALDGRLSGRDASRLPACTLDNQAVR